MIIRITTIPTRLQSESSSPGRVGRDQWRNLSDDARFAESEHENQYRFRGTPGTRGYQRRRHHAYLKTDRRSVDDDRKSSGQSGSDRQNSHAPGARYWDSLPGAKATTLEKPLMKLIIALIQPTKLEAVK